MMLRPSPYRGGCTTSLIEVRQTVVESWRARRMAHAPAALLILGHATVHRTGTPHHQ